MKALTKDEIVAYFKKEFDIELLEIQGDNQNFFLLTRKEGDFIITMGLDGQPDGFSVNLLGDPGELTALAVECTSNLNLQLMEPFIPNQGGYLKTGKHAYQLKAEYELSILDKSDIVLPGFDDMSGIPVEEVGEVLGSNTLKADDSPLISTPVTADELNKNIKLG